MKLLGTYIKEGDEWKKIPFEDLENIRYVSNTSPAFCNDSPLFIYIYFLIMLNVFKIKNFKCK